MAADAYCLLGRRDSIAGGGGLLPRSGEETAACGAETATWGGALERGGDGSGGAATGGCGGAVTGETATGGVTAVWWDGIGDFGWVKPRTRLYLFRSGPTCQCGFDGFAGASVKKIM